MIRGDRIFKNPEMFLADFLSTVDEVDGFDVTDNYFALYCTGLTKVKLGNLFKDYCQNNISEDKYNVTVEKIYSGSYSICINMNNNINRYVAFNFSKDTSEDDTSIIITIDDVY